MFENPHTIAMKIAQRAQQKRLEKNMTQQELADISTVSLGSIKRFETSYQISLQNLIYIAFALESTDEFLRLFTNQGYTTFEEAIGKTAKKTRKRARRNAKKS